MKLISLLTTWNRPKLLKQALEHIERECADVGSQLVIADDQSDNYHTLKLLEEAEKRGADVITRQWSRSSDDNPHYATGFHAVYSFKYVINKYNPDYILKLDDDCVISNGGFKCIIKAYEEAAADGYEVIACSGIQGIYEQQIFVAQDRSYCLVNNPCAVACIYPAYHFNIFLNNTSEGEIATSGWDHKFLDFRNKWFPNAVFANTFPFDVVYHAGFTGTHLINTDINRKGKFCGSLEGVYTE